MEYALTGTLKQFLAEVYQRRYDPYNTNTSYNYPNVRMNPLAKLISHTMSRVQMVKFGSQIAASLAYVHGKNVNIVFIYYDYIPQGGYFTNVLVAGFSTQTKIRFNQI